MTPAGGDLYAVRASGGPVVPITFSSVGEMRPALSPDGRRVAFLRGRAVADSTPGSIWVMDLLTGGEREVVLPRNAGTPRRVGWSRDGARLTVAAGADLYRASPVAGSLEAEPVPQADRPAAESTLAVLLGEPVFARVVPCTDPAALCVASDTGAPGLLAAHARDATRWGPDSVAFLTGSVIEVRPLGPGLARRIEWSGLPGRARELTGFAGRPDGGGSDGQTVGRSDGRTVGRSDGRRSAEHAALIPSAARDPLSGYRAPDEIPRWARDEDCHAMTILARNDNFPLCPTV